MATVTAGGIMIESTVMRVSDLLPTTLAHGVNPVRIVTIPRWS